MARKKNDDAAKKSKARASKAKAAEPVPTTTPSTPAATLSTLSNPSSPAVAWPAPTTLAEAPVQTRPDGEVTAPVEHLQAGLSTGPAARKLERLAWEGTVDVRGVFAGPVADTRAQNVSAGGVFVETAHLLEVGDPVVLSFADDDGGRLIVSGRVRWVTPFGRIADPTPGMGIEFIGLDSGKRHKLDALLQRNRS